MGLLRGAWRWARAADTTLSLLDMALRVIGASTVVSAVAAVVAWFAANPYAALVVGLGSWIAVAVLLLVLVGIGGRPEGTASQTHPRADDGSLPFSSPRPLPPDALSKPYLFDLSFRLLDLIAPEQTMDQTNVRGKTFYKCTIHGPAIVIPRDTRFTGKNEFFNEPNTEHPDSMLYPLEVLRTRTWYSGTVGAQGCVFRDCTFVDIGFMQDEPDVVKLRHHIAGGGDVEL